MTYHEQKAAMNGAEAIAGRFELVNPPARGGIVANRSVHCVNEQIGTDRPLG
jgi:hypothetical protein